MAVPQSERRLRTDKNAIIGSNGEMFPPPHFSKGEGDTNNNIIAILYHFYSLEHYDDKRFGSMKIHPSNIFCCSVIAVPIYAKLQKLKV